MYSKVCVLNIIEVVRYKFVIVVYSKVCIVVVVVGVGGGVVGEFEIVCRVCRVCRVCVVVVVVASKV